MDKHKPCAKCNEEMIGTYFWFGSNDLNKRNSDDVYFHKECYWQTKGNNG